MRSALKCAVIVGLLWASFFILACEARNPAADDDDTAGVFIGTDDDNALPVGDPAAFVDPFIGTGGIHWAAGNSNPGPMAPNGMVKLGPDTSIRALYIDYFHCGGYNYGDPTIRGFSHTHLPGTGIADMGNVRVMPVLGFNENTVNESGQWSDFNHGSEIAEPGYYSVHLDRFGIDAELTATKNAGFHRYRFPADSRSPYVVIDVSAALSMFWPCRDGAVNIDPPNAEISGFTYTTGNFSGAYGGMPVYFAARFSEPFADWGVSKQKAVGVKEVNETGCGIGAYAGFDPAAREVLIKVGISFISVEQAQLNLDEQIPDWDFDGVRDAAASAWEDHLSQIVIYGGTTAQRKIFYTSMYHMDVLPTDITEAGGLYQGFDRQTHEAQDFDYYTDLSLWDTFRSYHPLMMLLRPDFNRDVIKSMIRMYVEGGSLPVWAMGIGETNVMIGTHSDSVIGEAYVKGLRGFDINTAYQAMYEHATQPVSPGGRDSVEDWVDLGYVANDHDRESVSKTLEYAYNDFCISRIADLLGKTEDRDLFFGRSKNYAKLWDPSVNFFNAKDSNGNFEPGFNEARFMPKWLTEGNARHWRWFVLHDIPGLVDLFGGMDAFAFELNEFFAKGAESRNTSGADPYYWHGNEPDQQAAYLFDFISRPDLTAKWVRWIMATKYEVSPTGIDGNDDGGAIASWYIFSALGFYPVAPCSDLYFIGSPLFPRAEVRVGGGATLVVTAKDVSDKNIYVQSAMLNGRPLDAPWFRHGDIAQGGALDFVMGPNPSGWGRKAVFPGY